MPTGDVNGFAMHYRDTGGPASPVVFIHGGFPSVATLWKSPDDELDPWQRQVGRHHRLIRLFRRGFHPSACPTVGFAIDNQAADVIALLDLVSVEAAHVIASSSGGPIGYCLAAHEPTRVRSLVVVGTGLNLRRTLRDRPEFVRFLTEKIEDLHRLGPQLASDRRPSECAVSFDPVFMKDEFTQRGERDDYEERLRRDQDRLANVPLNVRVEFHTAEVRAVEAYLAWDGRQEAAAVRCPTLVVHGEWDRAISLEEGEELAALIPSSRLEVFPDSHSLLWRHEPALRAALSFLAEVDGERIP
jgi:3-oxoadipate enol-lactonase